MNFKLETENERWFCVEGLFTMMVSVRFSLFLFRAQAHSYETMVFTWRTHKRKRKRNHKLIIMLSKVSTDADCGCEAGDRKIRCDSNANVYYLLCGHGLRVRISVDAEYVRVCNLGSDLRDDIRIHEQNDRIQNRIISCHRRTRRRCPIVLIKFKFKETCHQLRRIQWPTEMLIGVVIHGAVVKTMTRTGVRQLEK